MCPFPFTGEKREDGGVRYTLVTKEDCLCFRLYVDDMVGFTVRYDRDSIVVWDRSNKGESMNQVKVFGTFDCKPEVLYAVLQDPQYREAWDESRVEGWPIVRLDERQDVSYYGARSPVAGVSAREFLSQRAWHSTGRDEYVIFNTSVNHPSIPAKGKDGRVRAISKVTGYFIQAWGDEGCSLTYTTQIDPQGWIPAFVMNFISTKFAPKVIENLRKACSGYDEWKKGQGDGHVVSWCGALPSPWDISVENKTHRAVLRLWVERPDRWGARGTLSDLVDEPSPSSSSSPSS